MLAGLGNLQYLQLAAFVGCSGQRAGAWTMSTCGSGRWLCLLGIWGEDNILIILSGFIVLKEADKIVVLDC